MRIALIYPYLDKIGGVEKVILQEIQDLHNLGHELVVYTAISDEGISLPDNVEVYKIPSWSSNPCLLLISFLINVHLKLRQSPPFDLYHFHTFCIFPPGKTLISFHSVHTAVLKALKSPWPERWIRKLYPQPIFLEYLTCKLFQDKKEYIAVSPKIKRELQSFFNVDPGKIHLLPNPLSFVPLWGEEKEKARRETRQRWNIPEDTFVFGFVANRLTGKGLELVVESLQKTDANFQVVIVGKFASKAQRELATLIAKDKRGRISYLGYCEEMSRIYPAFDTLISPSCYESFGLAIYEALASGVPCIISKYIGVLDMLHPEIVDDMVIVVENNPEEIAVAMEQAQERFYNAQFNLRELMMGATIDLEKIIGEVS